MRKIIHCDADCFFAAVEMRDDPSLRGRPLAVGGSADRRGVIATCNYEARIYGVRSAMPSRTALKLCPSLLIVPADFERYRIAAHKVRAIFQRYSDQIEPLSLDEAYLDVSDSQHCRGSATRIAEAIRADVAREVGITVSAGVAPNKFVAKVASDWRKPDGLFVVTPEQVPDFVAGLPVSRIHGVGPATGQRLRQLGIETCADLRRFDELALVEHFGRFGLQLYRYARGEDERPVCSSQQRKSLSVEHTFPEDLPDTRACLRQLPTLQQRLQERLQKLVRHGSVVGQFVKLKGCDFQTTTVDRQLEGEVDIALFPELLAEAWERLQQPVRLLGVGLRFRDREAPSWQLSLF